MPSTPPALSLATAPVRPPTGPNFELYVIVLPPPSTSKRGPSIHYVFEGRHPLPVGLSSRRREWSLVPTPLETARPSTYQWASCKCGKLVSLQGASQPPREWGVDLCQLTGCLQQAWVAVSGLPLSPSPAGESGRDPLTITSVVTVAMAARDSLEAQIRVARASAAPFRSASSPPTVTSAPRSDLSVKALATSFFTLSPVLPDLPGQPDSRDYALRWIPGITLEARCALAAAPSQPKAVRHSLKLVRVVQPGLLVLRLPSAKEGIPDPLQESSIVFHEPSRTIGVVVSIESKGSMKDASVLTYSAVSLVASPPRPEDARLFTPDISAGRGNLWSEVGSIQPMIDRVRALHRIPELDPGIRFTLTRDLAAHIDDDLGSPFQLSSLPWAPLDSGVVEPHPYVARLNPSQLAGLRSLGNPVECFQGPPGSGKSTVIAAIVTSCVRSDARILVTAPSNKAVEAIVSKLCDSWGVAHVLTVGSGRNTLDATRRQRLWAACRRSPIYQARLSQVQALAAAVYECSLLDGDATVPDVLSKALASAADALPAAIDDAARMLIDSVRVVVCTTSCAQNVAERLAADCTRIASDRASAAAASLQFQVAVLDENGATLEPDVLHSLFHGARCVALVGDPAQLPPYTVSALPGPAYAHSLISRFCDLAERYGEEASAVVGYRLLNIQFRCPRMLGDIISTAYYRGRLFTQYDHQRLETPIVVVPVPGVEQAQRGASTLNVGEAAAVADVVRSLCGSSSQSPISLQRVTVVTFYSAQLAAISAALSALSLPCSVATVDSMQGSENDVIILSTVRTGATGLGFLTDPQRLNVAISRCRELLVLVCHPHILDSLSIGRSIRDGGADFHPAWPSIRAALTTGAGHGTMEGCADNARPSPAALLLARASADSPLSGLLSDHSLLPQLALSRPTPLMALAAARAGCLNSAFLSSPPTEWPVTPAEQSVFGRYGAAPPLFAAAVALQTNEPPALCAPRGGDGSALVAATARHVAPRAAMQAPIPVAASATLVTAATTLALQRVIGPRVGPRLEIQLKQLRSGSELYGAAPAPQYEDEPVFFHSCRTSAFATCGGAPVLKFCTSRDLLLVPKVDAAWVATRGMRPRGPWPGFGDGETDLVIARLLHRRIAASTREAGSDGWIFGSAEGCEVMLYLSDPLVQTVTVSHQQAVSSEDRLPERTRLRLIIHCVIIAGRLARKPAAPPADATAVAGRDLSAHLAALAAGFSSDSDDAASRANSPSGVADDRDDAGRTQFAPSDVATDASPSLPLPPLPSPPPLPPTPSPPLPSADAASDAAGGSQPDDGSTDGPPELASDDEDEGDVEDDAFQKAQADIDDLIHDRNVSIVNRALTLLTNSPPQASEKLTHASLVAAIEADKFAAASALVAARRESRRWRCERDAPEPLASQLDTRAAQLHASAFEGVADKLGSGSERATLRKVAVAVGTAHVRSMEADDAAYRATLITGEPRGEASPESHKGLSLITGLEYMPRKADHVFDASAQSCTPAQFTGVRFVTDHDADFSGLSEPTDALMAGDTGGGQTVLGEGLEVEIRSLYPDAIKDVSDEEGSFPDRVLEVAGLGAVNRVLRTVSVRFKLADGIIRAIRVPVISGFYGFILGNQFNKSVSAEYLYSSADPYATFCYQHDYLGRLKTRMEFLSQRVEFGPPSAFLTSPTAGAVIPVAYTQGDDNTIPALVDGKAGRHWFKLRAHTGLSDGAVVHMEPLSAERFTTKGLLGVAGEQTVQDGHVWFHVMNLNPYPVNVGELTPIARFRTSRIAPELTVDEVMAAIHIGPCIADSPEFMSRLRDLVTKHLAAFRKSLRNSFTHAVKHRIVLKPGHVPRKDAPILRRSPRDEERYSAAARKSLDNGTASFHTGELLDYCCNQILVAKFDENGAKQDEEREVLDLRGVNENTADPSWPLPDIVRNLARLSGCVWFTLDLFSGFTQVELEDASKLLAAYYTPLGILLSQRMCQGLKGAPATFCRAIARVMADVDDVFCYFDDLASGAWDVLTLLSRLDLTLTRLGEAGWGVKAKKMWVGYESLVVTGFVVSKEGHRPNPERTRPIAEWSIQMLRDNPKVKVPQWLGLLNTYNRFIPSFALFAGVIRESVATGADTQAVMSSLRFRAAFELLCSRLMTAVACAVPDYSRRFYIMTDAALSGAASAVCYQIEDDGTSVIIAMWSEMFGVNDKNPIKVASRDFECYAVHQACCVKFAWVLDYAEQETFVYCDCKALETMMTTRFQRDSAVLRMANELSSKSFQFIWRPGHRMGVPDTLGRVVTRNAAAMHTLISLSRSESSLVAPESPRVSSLATLASRAVTASPDRSGVIARTLLRPSFGTLVNEAIAACDPRGCGLTVPVEPLFTDPVSGLTLFDPQGSVAVGSPLHPLPSTLSTTRLGLRKRVASVLIHPLLGALVCTGSDGSFHFPGGPFTRPGSSYRIGAAESIVDYLGAPSGVHLGATMRRCKSSADLQFELTHYVIYLLAERVAAAALVQAANGVSGSLVPVADLKSVSFYMKDDTRCAHRLSQMAAEASPPLDESSLQTAAAAVSAAPLFPSPPPPADPFTS